MHRPNPLTVLLPTGPTAESVQASYDWRQAGHEIAKKGSQAYDDCILLACQRAEEPFRVEVLQSWGIADAAIQIEAYAAMQQLDLDDPIRGLSNSQRIALFSQGSAEAPFLFKQARKLLKEGLPAQRITSAWAQSTCYNRRTELRYLQETARRQHGYKSSSQIMSEMQVKINSLEQELKEREMAIVSLMAEIETLSKERNNG